jgi:thiamine pyrophosphate-dependent acetolactate synthase large subunit-like protein
MVSRRDFITTSAASGLALGAGPAASALAQQGAAAPRPENALPPGSPEEVYEGTASGALLAQLKAAGMRLLFHTNTSGFVPFWEAIHAAGDVQVINLPHEGYGVAAAQGYTMAGAGTTLGFFFGSGVGVGNSLSNLYCAWKDRVPLIVTYTDGAIEGQGKDGFEDWDNHLGPTEPFTMWTGHLLTNEMSEIIRRAISFAYGPPSGPVTLVWGDAEEGQRVRAPIYKMDLAHARRRFRAEPGVIEKAAQWLAEARNPVFVVGPEIGEDNAYAEIQALAEKLSVPVVETKDVLYASFPSNHPLFLGQLEALRFPRTADVLVSFGEHFRRDQPLRGVPTVHVSHDPDMLGRTYAPDLMIASDLRFAIRDLSDALDGMLTRDRMTRIRTTRLADITNYSSEVKRARELALRGRFDSSPLTWERVGYELEQALDRDAVIVPELGSQYWKVMSQLTTGFEHKLKFGRTSGSALGWGMGAALGVSLALPGRQVVAVQGDGGFLFGQGEALWSISRYQAPMLIVILNNRSYNDSRVRNMLNAGAAGGVLHAEGRDYSSYLGDPHVDFTKFAEAFRLRGEKVRTPAELAPALRRSVASMRDGKAVVLDIDIAPDAQPMNQSSWYQPYSIVEAGRQQRRGGV